MRHRFRYILKYVGITFAVLLLLIVVATLLLNTSAVQNRLMRFTTSYLSKELKTDVSVKSVNISVIRGSVTLRGIDIKDRQNNDLLRLDKLEVGLNTRALLLKDVIITDANIDGLIANLVQSSTDGDTVPNYRFLLDFINDKLTKKDSENPSDAVNFDIKHAVIDIDSVRYTDARSNRDLVVAAHIDLSDITNEGFKASFNEGGVRDRLSGINVTGLRMDLAATDTLVAVSNLGLKKGRSTLSVTKVTARRKSADNFNNSIIDIDSLRYTTDNGKPRSNTGKPNHGAFDAGHLDICANLRIAVDSVGDEGIFARVTRGSLSDREAGLFITDIRLSARAHDRLLDVSDLHVAMAHTHVDIPSASVQLPDKEHDKPFSFNAPFVNGSTILSDIARPFAPPLKHFSTPLHLRCSFSGDNNALYFGNVAVSTGDERLHISASGSVDNLRDKNRRVVNFNVTRMAAYSGIKEQIIGHFAGKKYMMKQLRALGGITYVGAFTVHRRTVAFNGNIGTEKGHLRFDFLLDRQSKYITGNASTPDLLLGEVMDMPDFGAIDCQARFKLDINRQRTARLKSGNGGKLPIGSVEAQVNSCRYKKLVAKNISATITSNGAQASGTITDHNKLLDLSCNFTFTDTDEMRKMKISHPKVKIHL